MPLILFPSEPFSLRDIDPDFEHERAAARRAGLQTALVDHTRITRGAAAEAVAHAPEAAGEALYRGWMLRPAQYAAMYEALHERGIKLVNDPTAYQTCHYFPDSYPFIRDRTPASVWMRVQGNVDFDLIARSLVPFGGKPLIVKDYVKSQKHYWNEACFIPAADNAAAVRRVVTRFLELQGEDLNDGLVFRELAPLKVVGTHPKSGLPLAAEFRTLWLNGELILAHRYWGELTEVSIDLPLEALRAIAARIPSRFFTIDIAFKQEGDWLIIELGDGQVTGLPSPDLAPEFFKQLATKASDKSRSA